MTTDRTAIRRRLAIRSWSHRPPWGARKAGHDSIVAPLSATVAATLAVGVGLMLARSERRRRRALEDRRKRRLGRKRGEPLVAGLRRMALSQADLAIEQLAPGPPDEKAVHETRKALKRLRALLRLLEHELGAETYARESATLRDVASHLSGARDAAVMLSTLDALIERHPRKLAKSASVRKLRRRLQTERARLQQHTLAEPASRGYVLGELHAFRWRVATWQLSDKPGIELVDSDLSRLYRQGRQRYRRAALDRGKRITTMHEWRKRVKDLRYAAEMLDRRGSSESAPALRKIAGRADDLSELLGEDHDLAIFAQHMREAGRRSGSAHIDAHQTWRTGAGTRRTLLKLIAKRRRKLRVRALRQGARLYSVKPKRFTRRIRRLS
jgi:CHAD domain-containing protein